MEAFQNAAAVSAVVFLSIAGCCLLYLARSGSIVTFLRSAVLRFRAPGPTTSGDLTVVSPKVGREVFEFLGCIPIPPVGTKWWQPFEVVDPDLFVRLVAEKGLGNCANRSMAFARWLHLRGIPFGVVTIGRDPLYRIGGGHTLLEVPVSFDGENPCRWILVDPLSSGIVMDGGTACSYTRMLARWPHGRLSVARSKGDAVDTDDWFDGSQGAEFLGYSRGSEVGSFLRFSKAFASTFGNHRLGRRASIFIALVLGVYPRVYVDQTQFLGISARIRFDSALSRVAIWSLRACACASVALAVSFVLD